MITVRRSIQALVVALLLASVTVSLSTCGGIGGSEFAGGGTGGTGISTGSISGFGSVVMNGVHYRTDKQVAPGFQTKKFTKGKADRTSEGDRDVFRIGMVVTVHHSFGDNNAVEIDYAPNLVGPIAAKDSVPDLVLRVLGHTVVLDNAGLFDNLAQSGVVEISGFVDASGRIRATYVEPMHPAPLPGETFEIKGFISDPRPSDRTFEIGPLPDGSGSTVTVSYTPGAIRDLPAEPTHGMYVQVVTRDTQPVSGGIRADIVTPFAPRTVFPEGATVDIEGLVTAPWSGSENDLSFAVEGKRVRWKADTEFGGGARDDLRQTNVKVQVHGMENGGFLSAARIVFR